MQCGIFQMKFMEIIHDLFYFYLFSYMPIYITRCFILVSCVVFLKVCIKLKIIKRHHSAGEVLNI